MTRRQAREIIFSLIYESDFHRDTPFIEIYNEALADRSFQEDAYVKTTFLGIEGELSLLDGYITEHAVKWKADRISKVSRAIMRLCIYEMLHADDVPPQVAINEALELAKIYDDDKAPAFINGVLNAFARAKGLISNTES